MRTVKKENKGGQWSLYGEESDLKYLLALTFVKDIGPVTAKRLLSAFRSPRRIFEASLSELKSVEEVKESRAQAIRAFDEWNRVEEEIGEIGRRGITMIKYTDKEYPESLRQFDGSPMLLYVKGDLVKEDRYAIAMVGSRDMSEYGGKVAHKLAYDLASRGLTVVSGMARGIDTVSHKGALRAGGRSIAVLGCGLDKLYPPENGKLFENLSHSGCIISEFPLGTEPVKENFPRRNRLISGLSLGTLVVEAALDSGSLITAHYALEQNREVFAVPGNITSINSKGTNALIKKGAKLVQKADDVMEELAPLLKGLLHPREITPEKIAALEINDEEKAICNILRDEPRHIDTIARELGMAPAKLSGLLLGLEIKGVIRQTEGNNFHLL